MYRKLVVFLRVYQFETQIYFFNARGTKMNLNGVRAKLVWMDGRTIDWSFV